MRIVKTKSWIIAVSLLAAACNRPSQNPESVKQGIVEHLGKNAGLDLTQLDVNVTNVQFKGSEATATVNFQPKGSPGQGMTMNYTLERQGDKWAVVKRAGSSGHAEGPVSQPPGAPAAPTGDLPPGHPPLDPGKPAK
jgi:hypothetical protein